MSILSLEASLSPCNFRPQIDVIETNYDPGLHETPPYTRLDGSERYLFTEKERDKAEHAVPITSLEELRLEVSPEMLEGYC
jgi:hypothetical protein